MTDLANNIDDLTAPRQRAVVSIGQFRPEKDHVLQLEALEVFRHQYPDCLITLVLIGSCRGSDDELRLAYLRNEVKRRNLNDCVEFVVNQPYNVLKGWLEQGSVGIHTVRNTVKSDGCLHLVLSASLELVITSLGPQQHTYVVYFVVLLLDVERTFWDWHCGNDGRWTHRCSTQFGWTQE